MYTATRMSEKEALLYEVAKSDRPALVRIDDAKNNLTAGSPDAVWFKLIGVDLYNGTDLYPNEANVQTVERWYLPYSFAKLDPSTIERISRRSRRGLMRAADTAHRRLPKPARPGAWCTKLRPALSEQQAKYVIATWFRSSTSTSTPAVRQSSVPCTRRT